MLRHLTRSAALATAVAAAVLLPATSADAWVFDRVSWAAGLWTSADCATGTLTGATFDTDVIVYGDAGLCGAVPASQPEFGIARYHLEDKSASPYARDDRARYFYASGRRSFGVRLHFTGKREAICLLASPTNRLACGIVSVDGKTQEVTFQALSTADPLVAKPAEFGNVDPAAPLDTKPECATCF